jgi:hypothetical protein
MARGVIQRGQLAVEKARAARGYEAFTGHKPTKSQVHKLDERDRAGYRLGSMVGVAYEATRDGKKDQYFHRFKKKARPELVARGDGRQLYIAGGDYHITDRGIEDMPHLFVVNPSPRKAKKAKASTGRRRKRSASGQFKRNPSKRKAPQMAATRRRKRRTTRRASFKRNPIANLRRNPVRRRRRRASYRRNPITARRRRGFRRNPVRVLAGRGSFRIGGMILPAAMIGAGAVGVELLMGYAPLPSFLTTGPARYVTKGVLGVLAGFAIAKFVNRKAGEAFAAGGIAIATHDAIRAAVGGFAPGLKFGGYNWDKYGYDTPSLNSYPNNPGIGYYSPGSTLRGSGVGEYMGEYVGAGDFQA